MFCSLTLKEKGGDGFLFIPRAQKVSSARNTRWRQRKLTPRLDFGPFWDYVSWNTAQDTSTYSFPPVFLTSFGQIVYVLRIHLTLLSHVRHPSPQILLVPYFSSLRDKPNNLFSHVKCALCSHLQTSCKSLWLVYTPVYFSCRGLSPLFAITPFKEPLSWKLPRVYADYFPQST